MPEPFEIRLDEEQMRELDSRLRGIPNALPKVIARSINRAIGHLRTLIVRRARAETKMPSKAVRSKIWFKRATRVRLQGRLGASKRGFALTMFGAKQTPTGVSAVIPGIDRLQDIPHGFIATMPKTGHTGVFTRIGRERKPIREHTTMSISYAILASGATPAIVASGRNHFLKRLIAETDLILEGKRNI